MRILHVSDIHAWAPPRSIDCLLDKRLLAHLNVLLNRRQCIQPPSLQALAEIVRTLDPREDAIVCTGDLTCTGDTREFACALEPILRMAVDFVPDRTLYLPGNHDRYIRRPAEEDEVPNVSQTLNGTREIPLLRTIGNVEFLFLDAAVPRPFFISSGVVTADQVERLRAFAAVPRTPGVLRILVSHFPVFPEKAVRRNAQHGLKGAAAIQSLILENRLCDLCLCGHVHHPFVVELPGFTQLCAGSVTFSQTALRIDIASDGSFTHHRISLSSN